MKAYDERAVLRIHGLFVAKNTHHRALFSRLKKQFLSTKAVGRTQLSHDATFVIQPHHSSQRMALRIIDTMSSGAVLWLKCAMYRP